MGVVSRACNAICTSKTIFYTSNRCKGISCSDCVCMLQFMTWPARACVVIVIETHQKLKHPCQHQVVRARRCCKVLKATIHECLWTLGIIGWLWWHDKRGKVIFMYYGVFDDSAAQKSWLGAPLVYVLACMFGLWEWPWLLSQFLLTYWGISGLYGMLVRRLWVPWYLVSSTLK
jgi:hypothetical protein